MNKKIAYLLVALALPGLIFIFLKIFGKNHFDIPVYYKAGISDSLKECSGAHHGQYTVPDSALIIFGYKKDVVSLFVDASEIDNKELEQLKQSFKNQLQIISLVGIEPTRLNRIKKCNLFLKEPWKAVLVDKQKQIRGYYAFSSLEETDRLNVEVDILLANN
jgi:protein SCO1/2